MVQKLKLKKIKGGSLGQLLVREPPIPWFSFTTFWRFISFIARFVDVLGNFVSILVIIIACLILQMVLNAIHATLKPLTKIPLGIGKEIKKIDKKIARTVWELFMMFLKYMNLVPNLKEDEVEDEPLFGKDKCYS